MTYTLHRALLTIATLCAFTAPVYAQAPKAIVELYTSQNCASCPPADKILEELSKYDEVLTLSCHVAYWDSPISKDDLAQDFCMVRQHGYIGIIGAQRVYTPHMVINGYAQVVGSNGPDVKEALNKTANDHIEEIKLSMMSDAQSEKISFTLPDLEQGNYRLWGFGYINEHERQMAGGENKGLKVKYIRPAMSYNNLGPWDGNADTLEFEKPEKPLDGFVLFAQKDGYGTIVAAGEIAF